ncbi:MAG TPA: hypothetical protein VG146_13740 [Verrucomicrobiae bacterium]|nr:hypothetical protein [Verrucomicrobiae bacterium]
MILTLVIAGALGLFLFYYLNLSRTQRNMLARSQAWNSALGIAESGVEEALAQLNPATPQPVIDRAANGWGQPSGGIYGPMSRALSSGSYSVEYTTDSCPVIYSTGYVAVASLAATLSRTLLVTTTNIPLFTVAMAAKYNINFNGNGVNTDSFNSANTNLSTGGLYDPAKTSTNGDIASSEGIINVNNGNVNGNVYLSPTGTNSISKNGTITGDVYYNFNADFGDVALPQTTWLPLAPLGVPSVINGVSYQYVITVSSGDYQVNNLTGNLYVGTNSDVRLLLTGNASPSNIRVAGPGTDAGHLVIYMAGPSFTLSGASTVDGGNAGNLNYFGTTNNTSINFSGNSSFTGTLYAPEAAFSLGGGGSSTYNVVGSVVANTISINGHFNFHYDENLLNAGPMKGYGADDWREL